MGAAGGIVLLVHGTALTGQETWATGPFVTILPTKGYVLAIDTDNSLNSFILSQTTVRRVLHRDSGTKLERRTNKRGIRGRGNSDPRAAIEKEWQALYHRSLAGQHCERFPGRCRGGSADDVSAEYPMGTLVLAVTAQLGGGFLCTRG